VKLFVFGLGYAARAFIAHAGSRFDAIAATSRDQAKAGAAARIGVSLHRFDGGSLDEAARRDLCEASHVLVSVPPEEDGDPVVRVCAPDLAASGACLWIGYLSSVAVYGDRAGQWVDEGAALDATSARGRLRIAAVGQWLALGRRIARPVHIFRLAGIYGPGRNALDNLRQGRAKRLIKPGQVFNRIHVEDIARILAASIDHPRPGGVWNVADDEPAPPQDVVAFAAGLLGVAAPPETPFDEARLTPMAASFYADNKRVANRRVKQAFGLALRYQTFREGLRALAAQGEGG
jgi:nucleoside-diphosphate-sugar epimerase